MRKQFQFILTLLLLFSCGDVWAKPSQIVVVLSQESDAYQRIAQLLTERAIQENWDLQVRSVSDLNQIDNNLVDVYLPVGSIATQAVLAYRSHQTVLAVMLTRSAYKTLQPGVPTFSAILLDQPPQRILALAQLLLPNKHIGFIAGISTASVGDSYLNAAKQMSISTTMANIEGEVRAARAINYLLDDSEVIIALPDAMVMKPTIAKWLLYMAYQQEVPVIGFSQAYVKAGALAAVYSAPEDLARQSVEWLQNYFLRRQSIKMQSHYPQYFNVAVNNWVARSLKISIPDNQLLVRQIDELSRRHM